MNYVLIFFSDWTDQLFTSILAGAAGILTILLVLLIFLFYKYKQVRVKTHETCKW